MAYHTQENRRSRRVESKIPGTHGMRNEINVGMMPTNGEQEYLNILNR